MSNTSNNRTRAKVEESLDTMSVTGEDRDHTSTTPAGSGMGSASMGSTSMGSSMEGSSSEGGSMTDTVTTRLKSVGVDTDQMVTAAKDQATELQRMLGEELRTHPMRTLGIAAAVGVFVGLLTAR